MAWGLGFVLHLRTVQPQASSPLLYDMSITSHRGTRQYNYLIPALRRSEVWIP